ncbi:MAG: KEOPS complex kinase/ATPase Bud32 [Nitrososphaerales archaeon]
MGNITEYILERLIKKGAEADIYEARWYGLRAIAKIRKAKEFRNPELDYEIRRKRTLREAKLIALAKSFGIPTPLIYFVDPNTAEIVMQFIEGIRLRELSLKEKEKALPYYQFVGKNIALLHKNRIIHGDLTTSNFIISQGKPFLIDFGLAFLSDEEEDKAVDLHLIKQILLSQHYDIYEEAFNLLLEGYRSILGEIGSLIRKIKEIERRGRYARVV